MNQLNESELQIINKEKKKKLFNRILVAIILIPAIFITYLRCELFLLNSPGGYGSTSLVVAALFGAFISSLFIPLVLSVVFFAIKRLVFKSKKGTFLLPFSIALLLWSSFMFLVNFGKLVSPYLTQ